MKNILSRIQQIADHENLKITAFEKRIGASKGVLSHAIKNKTDIQSKWIRIIAENYPQYNVEWLITGEGEMLKTAFPVVETPDKTINRLIEEIKRQAEENTILKIENKALKEKNEQLTEKFNGGSTLYNYPSIVKP